MVIFHCCVNVYQRVGLEHGPFIDALPCKDGEFSIANSSNYQMVNPTKSTGEKKKREPIDTVNRSIFHFAGV